MSKLKWSKTEHAYFSKPIPTAKNDDAIVWFILSLVSLSGAGYWIWWVLTR